LRAADSDFYMERDHGILRHWSDSPEEESQVAEIVRIQRPNSPIRSDIFWHALVSCGKPCGVKAGPTIQCMHTGNQTKRIASVVGAI